MLPVAKDVSRAQRQVSPVLPLKEQDQRFHGHDQRSRGFSLDIREHRSECSVVERILPERPCLTHLPFSSALERLACTAFRPPLG